MPLHDFSLKAAVVDDDPFQAEILTGVAEAADLAPKLCCAPFYSLDAFTAAASEPPFDLVFLDRRLPDCDNFNSALAALARIHCRSPLILMSALTGIDPVKDHGLTVHGPIDKLELSQPIYFKRLMQAIITPMARAYG